jgi:hypothetical protein
VYLNTSEPFALITVGVQGGGKSHTTAVVLESCLIPCPAPSESPMIQLDLPMSALVLHYDTNESNVCEATGMAHLSRRLEQVLDGCVACWVDFRPFIPH